MNPHLMIKKIVCKHGEQFGERLPLLVNRDSGVPLFWPSLYTSGRLYTQWIVHGTVELDGGINRVFGREKKREFIGDTQTPP